MGAGRLAQRDRALTPSLHLTERHQRRLSWRASLRRATATSAHPHELPDTGALACAAGAVQPADAGLVRLAVKVAIAHPFGRPLAEHRLLRPRRGRVWRVVRAERAPEHRCAVPPRACAPCTRRPPARPPARPCARGWCAPPAHWHPPTRRSPLGPPPRACGSGALWRHTGPSHAPLGTAGLFERLFFRLDEEQQVLVYYADDQRLTASRNRPLGTPTPAPVPPGAVHHAL